MHFFIYKETEEKIFLVILSLFGKLKVWLRFSKEHSGMNVDLFSTEKGDFDFFFLFKGWGVFLHFSPAPTVSLQDLQSQHTSHFF